uniref:Exonuclease 3'-5' domain containing 1 n=1 Tax=Paramormyrops kingsleyae TaxID=1676925 RepID=A0A3B3R624_9TELE|nr:piRNA biogenesis protein EXD1 [Paramormyrops kingsleyae]
MGTMEDCQFLESFKNKRLKITLKSATYVGTIQRVNLNKTLILEDVVDFQSGRKFPGTKLFFGREILNVELPPAPECDNGGASDRDKGKLTVSEFQPYRKLMKLGEDEADSEYVDFVVVDEFYEKFSPAVMNIRKRQVIGIAADALGAFPHARLCWLQISTKDKVYLFDILQLGARAFKNGLSMILENKHILKVTHGCRGISACLLAQYNVNLTNIFDTQLADVLHFHMETGGLLPERVSTLQEVVGLHLKVAPSRLSPLKIKDQLAEEDGEVWYVRPCPTALLKVMALSVIHLQPLRLVLLDALLSDYTDLVDAYLEHSRQDSIQVQDFGSCTGLELPPELRKLEQTKLERRKKALDRFPVTHDGLLVRYGSGPLGDQVALPVGSEHHDPAEKASKDRDSGLKSDPVPTLGKENSTPRLLETAAKSVGGASQMEGVGCPVPYPAIGRGLALLTPTDDSAELSGASEPRMGGGSAEVTPVPPPAAIETPVAWMGGIGGGISRGLHIGAAPYSAMCFGRGHFFQKIPPYSP